MSRRSCLALVLVCLVPLGACSRSPRKKAERSGEPELALGRDGARLRHVDLGADARRTAALGKVKHWAPPAGAAAAAVAAPISLTDASGQGLVLTSLKARGVIEGPLAFTELHLSFRNPQDRVIEGRFQITLPPRAAVSRFAMKQETGWQEAEVVERKYAQQVYEDFLHRRVDPALLEKQAGNQFQARIFPIPASGTKEIVISYSEALGLAAPYSVHLRGLPEVDEVDVAVVVKAAAGVPATAPLALRRTKQKPDADYVLALTPPKARPGLRSGRLLVAPVRPPIPDEPMVLDSLLVLFDTSASRTLGFGAQVDRLGALVRALAAASPALRLKVAAFDQAVYPVYEGAASGLGAADLERLRVHGPLGASDLHRALSWAGTQRGYGRVLLVTDAVPTAGETDAAVLRGAVTRLRSEVLRLDVLLAGGLRDEELAAQLVRGNLGEDGVVLSEDAEPATWVDRMRRATRSGIHVNVPGSAWAWPTTLDGLQAGEEALIYAEWDGEAPPEVTIALHGGVKAEARVALEPVAGPLLSRALMAANLGRLRARMATLPPRDEKGRAALRQELITLSTRWRVLTDETALLVLETERDYVRFGIDRRALADILTVDEQGIAVVKRTDAVLGKGEMPNAETPDAERMRRVLREGPPPPPPPTSAEAGRGQLRVMSGGSGNWGGFGKGGGGGGGFGLGGGGGGVGFGKYRSGSPMVFMSKATVQGGLDADTIRRVIRRHLQEIQYCYVSVGLPTNPRLGGMVKVTFIVDPRGSVPSATVAQSTLGHGPTEACILAAVKRWRFPKPEGQTPYITYPFHFKPNDRDPGVAGPGRGSPPRPGSRPDEPPPPPPPPPVDPAELQAERAQTFVNLVADGKPAAALDHAVRWRAADPGDSLAYVVLGEALRTQGDLQGAARAFGSVIDLYPSRADLRRFAGGRLERLGEVGRALAVDTYRVAVAQRPDHPASHHLLALALLGAGRPAEAFAALEAALDRTFHDRYLAAKRILAESLELVGAAWAARDPGRLAEITRRLAKRERRLATTASLRFVLSWETDANDVDFHIHDGRGDHAYYSQPKLSSGGALYADVRDGYGPECFTIPGTTRVFPYRLEINYFSRGPMGYGMGKVDVIDHDGKGTVRHEVRPYIIYQNGQTIDLGRVNDR